MKYVRTKDGIYEVENDIEYTYKNDEENHLLQAYKDVYEEFGEETNWTDLGEIIKYAATIEELCDEFVLYDEDIKRCHILDKGFYHRFNEESKKALNIVNRYIYSAIWTDRGLIYVAKMNEKGELCLL